MRHGLWIPALFVLAIALALMISGSLGLDAHAYWASWRNHLYTAAPEHAGAYLYSPAFAEAIWPLTLLPWPLFCSLWIAMVATIYLWLLAPLELRWRIPLLLLCSADVATGNVWSLFALVIVFGFRFPSIWAFPVLTKVTPGIGPIWFLVRREWLPLLTALSATAVIVGVSAIAAPQLWGDWITLLLHPASHGGGGHNSLRPVFYPSAGASLAVRMPVAVTLTAVAARTDRRWLVPVAMVLAQPVLTSNSLVMLAAIPRLRTPGLSGARLGWIAPPAARAPGEAVAS